MFALLLSLIGLAAAQCPQTTFSTRTEFQRGTNQDGFDIQYWYHRGQTFIGQSSNAMFAGTLNAGETFSSSTPFATATADDLKANGDQWFMVLGQIDLTGAVVGEECMLTVGSTPKFCIKRNARWEFTNQFGLLPTAAPSAANPFAFTARRFNDNGVVKISYEALNRGTTITRANGNPTTGLPSAVWDFSQGFTFNAPLTGQTTKITQFMVLSGRGALSAAATTFMTGAAANSGSFANCVLQEWVTGTPAKPYAVPADTAGNLVATFRRTNFQTTPAPAIASAPVTWNPAPADISTVTSVAGSSGVVVAAFTTPTTTTVSFPQLEPGTTQSVTFTASVFSCTRSGRPRTPPAGEVISVNSVNAQLFILRESRLAFTVVDKRPFDLVDLPIAAGCDVPFTYEIDITNLGPSCVENLELHHVFEPALDASSNPASTFAATPATVTAALILPGKVRTGLPDVATITATAAAGNEQSLNRSLTLVGPLDDGVFSTSLPQPHYSFFRRTRVGDPANLNILGQSYEIARYGDLQLTFEWVDDSVVAGDFTDTTSPNLRGVLRVKNAGCVAASDVELVLVIDQPRGSWYFDNVGVGATNTAQRLPKITRHIKVGTLDTDETRAFDIEFAVCQLSKASTSALSVNAFVLRSGATDFNGDLQVFETVEPAQDGTKFTRLVPVNRFDDKVSASAAITLAGALDVKLECDAPKLISSENFAADGSEDGTTSESVHDVDLAKLTRCRVKASNSGASNVALKIKLDWVLPEGTRLVRWSGPENDRNQFVADNGGGVWAVLASSNANTPTFNKCPARVANGEQKLELDFVSNKHGDIQIVARVDKQASLAALSGSAGNARTIQV